MELSTVPDTRYGTESEPGPWGMIGYSGSDVEHVGQRGLCLPWLRQKLAIQ
jgi:hypothetical protein